MQSEVSSKWRQIKWRQIKEQQKEPFVMKNRRKNTTTEQVTSQFDRRNDVGLNLAGRRSKAFRATSNTKKETIKEQKNHLEIIYGKYTMS